MSVKIWPSYKIFKNWVHFIELLHITYNYYYITSRSYFVPCLYSKFMRIGEACRISPRGIGLKEYPSSHQIITNSLNI